MKPVNCLLLIVLFAIFGSSFNSNNTLNSEPDDTIKVLDNLLDPGFVRALDENPGGEVNRHFALACSPEYVDEMRQHAITEKAKKNPTLKVTRHQQITEYVYFGGRKLREWITKTIPEKYSILKGAEKGKDIEMRIVLGIYDDDFIAAHPEHDLKPKKGRITVFLVPFPRKGFVYLPRADDAEWADKKEQYNNMMHDKLKKRFMDGEEGAYNLGGLQP